MNVDVAADSVSFNGLLANNQEQERTFQFSECMIDTENQWAVSNGEYKLIESDTGIQELYELEADPCEQVNLIESGSVADGVIGGLESIADQMLLALPDA